MSTIDKNSCGIVTILPMGVVTFVEQPSTPTAADGTVALYITGGTSPYSITWSNGQTNTQFLSGVTVGTYTATVVDYYGDYTGSSTAVLSGIAVSPSPTPTPTPSATPTPTYSSFMCMTLNGSPYTQYEFGYQGIINGRPSWSGTSFDMVYDSTDARWEISGWTGTGDLVKYTNAYTPTGTWNQLGTDNTWNVATGQCTSQPLALILNTTNETCSGLNNGTLTVSVTNGTSPYTYSINGGATQSSNFFSSIPPGNSYVTVVDASANTVTENFTINAGPLSQTYSVQFTQTITSGLITQTQASKTMVWTASITPSLPTGVSVTFNINFNHVETDNYVDYGGIQQNASFVSASTISSVGSATVNSTTSSQSTNGSTITTCGGQSGVTHSKVYNVTLSGGYVTGTINSTITNDASENPSCPVYGTVSDSLGISGVGITGTMCGNVSQVVTPITMSTTTNPFNLLT